MPKRRPAQPARPGAPSLRLLATEPVRAAVEYARMRFMRREDLPTGDAHPVVIFPGLATDQRFTMPLARHCQELGYRTHDWGRGFNTGPEGDVDGWLDLLAADVDALIVDHAGKATLIGWSLGGIYAREIAKRLPRRVRQVISIGTPFAGTPEHTNVAWLYRLLNGNSAVLDPGLSRRLRAAPPMPTTSIYSRSDGVVAWQACRERPAEHAENIEVASSHIGLVWHPDVLAIVADRLSQPEHAWRPYAPASGLQRVA